LVKTDRGRLLIGVPVQMPIELGQGQERKHPAMERYGILLMTIKGAYIVDIEIHACVSAQHSLKPSVHSMPPSFHQFATLL